MAEKSKKKGKSKTSLRVNSGVENQENQKSNYDSKKPSMKTASDVISRLLWDESLPKEKFSVGYLDRFDGIIEKSFGSLDWNDPAIVDNNTLALPKHRIQYFKYRNRKVWDKRNRTDIVFGSTGHPMDIYGFMAFVDQEELNFQDEEIRPRNTENKVQASEDAVDDESDDEYDDSERPNFFIAARISDTETVKNLRDVSDYMKSRDELLSECCIPPERYHLTICILKLDSPGEVCDAVAAMQSVANQVTPLVTLNLDGLDNFRHRVLFSRVSRNENLQKLRQSLVDELTSRKLKITDRFSFVPHVTVAKLSRPVARIRHSNFIDQYLYLKFEDDVFGNQNIHDLYLCEMGAACREDGFYRCAGEVSLLLAGVE